MEKRESWKSRTIFIFAAIGSAVGLGNAWRFPGLAAKYGGGAFLLVYIAAMFILGWPLLMMEIGIGRRMQQGAPGSMRGINKKAEFVGWAATGNAFLIATYYAVVLAWILFMIVKSFTIGGLSPEQAGNVFTGEVLQNTPITTLKSLDIPWGMLLALLAAWFMIYMCIRKGAHSAGKVVPFTVLVPIILLVILAVRGIVGDAQKSFTGLAKLFIPDWKAFGNYQLWLDAFGQVFYSLSIMMAIMFAYGSFVHKKSNIISDTLIISLSDMLISVLSGIVLFTTLSTTGQLETFIAGASSGEIGSVGTAFIVYPQAMVLLSNNATLNSFFSVVFYLTLLTLAIDSAFSIIEGVSTAISDKFALKKKNTTRVCCLLALVVSLLFATKGGLSWLDIVDNWCNSFNLIGVGIIECLIVGWGFRPQKLRDEINRSANKFKIGSWYDWIIRVVAPGILAVLFLWNVVNLIIAYATGKGGYGGHPIWAQLIAGWLPTVLIFGGAVAMQIVSRKSEKIKRLDARYGSWDDMEDIDALDAEEEAEEERAETYLDPQAQQIALSGVYIAAEHRDSAQASDSPTDR